MVAVPTQGQVPLRVASLSFSSVTLYKGTNVARFYSLASSDGTDATSDGTDAETLEYCEVPLSAQGQARRVHQVGLPQSAATLLCIDTSNMDKANKQALEELVLEFAEIFTTGNRTWAVLIRTTTASTPEMNSQLSRLLATYLSTIKRRLANSWMKCCN